MVREYVGGVIVKTRETSFVTKDSTERDRAMYLSAVERLTDLGLLRHQSEMVWKVTGEGFTVSDRISLGSLA